MELLSVIVPVYNVELYLEECVNSILSQSYSNIEVILVDDGSTDSSGEICDRFGCDERVTVLHKENGGLSSARNYGIQHARGEYLSFVDSDDLIDSRFLESLYDALKAHGEDSKISMCRFTRSENSFTSAATSAELTDSSECLRRILYQTDDSLYSVSSCNKLYHRSVFDAVAYPEGHLNEDMYVICEVLSETKYVSVIDRTMYYYRTNPHSITNKTFKPKNMDVVDACDHIAARVHGSPVLEKAAVNMKFRRCYQMLYKLWQSGERYDQYENRLYSFIRQSRGLILKDADSKRSSKLTALMTLAGRPVFKALTNIVFRRKR